MNHYATLITLCITVLSYTLNDKLPKEFYASVIGIKDGDTIEVLYKKEPITIRLEHIDCPEKKQPFGQKAKKYVADICFGKEVKVISKGKFDRYRRLIAVIEYQGENINKKLVSNGYALHFKKYSKDTTYAILEEKARCSKKGMWSQEHLIEPWAYRKRKSKKKVQ